MTHFAAFGSKLERLSDLRVNFQTPPDRDALVEAIASRVEGADRKLKARGAVGIAMPGREVFCDSDANCFALAERHGVARGVNPGVMGAALLTPGATRSRGVQRRRSEVHDGET